MYVKQHFNQPLALSEPGPTRTPDRTRRQTKSTCKTRRAGPGRPCRVLALADRPQGDRHREHAINSSALTTPRTRPLLNCFTTPCLRSLFSVKADSPPDQALLLFWDGEVEVFDIPVFSTGVAARHRQGHHLTVEQLLPCLSSSACERDQFCCKP